MVFILHMFDRELIFSYVNLKKVKQVYATAIPLILYSIWVHAENAKYKMICLKSPKNKRFC